MYADDFFSGVCDLTDEQVGVYAKLLCLAWSKDGLTDTATLQASRDDDAIRVVLSEKFYRDGNGKWRNPKQEEIRAKQKAKQQKGSKTGANGEQNRSKTEAKADHQRPEPEPETREKNQNHFSPPTEECGGEAAPSADVVFEFWKEAMNEPNIKLTPKRREKINTRLKAPFWRDNWQEMVRKVSESKFCQGVNRRGWRADIDWFIRNAENGQKALEGRYDEREAQARETEAVRF
jgi:uncharacterized protein YdaU (DUF1376 family)